MADLRQTAPRALQDKIRSARAGMEGERKLVTALFADIVGSTELAEAMDPEDWREVVTGAHERISGIIKAVKSYSYLDQAPVQLVDVHEGLENTLVILRHKLKGGVTVLKEYAPDLPRIEAYASELNQVWTNLIDNAIDAMDGRGEIRIRTYCQDRSGEGGSRQYIVVEISDSGPGIPPAVQGRIFEAFFTTKEPGKGTGLGLHISYNIIVSQHRGEIKVASQPGQTTFQVTLPVALGR